MKQFFHVPFDDAVRDATGGNPKVLTSGLAVIGRFPVVDQGQEFVSGYVDDEELLCHKNNSAVILFGDHTKVIKYVDFDFVLGADGVKVLEVRPGFDTRFIFHYLNTIRLPDNLGYSRHFKYLKRESIPKPPIDEQRRIAAILDKADAIRKKRRDALMLADEFLRSVFLDMFGDPVKNPKGWKSRKLATLGDLQRGKSRHRPRNEPALYDGAYPFIQTGDVANCNGVIERYQQTYSELGFQQSRLWKKGTLCITIAANIGKTGILGFDACFPDSIVGFTPGTEVTSEYIQFWLGCIQGDLEREAPQVAQKNINLEILSCLDTPLPPLPLQKKFSSIAMKIRAMKTKYRKTDEQADNFFASLSNRAFSGQL